MVPIIHLSSIPKRIPSEMHLNRFQWVEWRHWLADDICWFMIIKSNGMIASVLGMCCGWQLFVVIRHYYQSQLSDVSWFAYEFRPRDHLRCIIKMMEIGFPLVYFCFNIAFFLFRFISVIVMIKETIYSYYSFPSDAASFKFEIFNVLNFSGNKIEVNSNWNEAH